MRKENYITIQGFMVADLGLKGNELLIYAIIYGFSQDGENTFHGGLQYLASWTNSTKQSVMKCLKSLCNKGYIEKIEKVINNVKFCEYKVKELSTVVNKIQQGGKQSLMGGKQSLPNNIILDNKSNNKDNNIYEQEFAKLWELYPNKKGKQVALKAYIKARKSGVLFEDVEKGIRQYKEYVINVPETYQKHGSTWFNQHCWEDEVKQNDNMGTADDDDFWYDEVEQERNAYWE